MEKGKYYYKVASPEYIKQASLLFDEELARQVAGKLEAGHVYQLGYPGELLQAAGFPDNKIEMLASHLLKKSQQDNHLYDIKDVKGFVSSLNNPLAVFSYGSKSKAQNVIIEQESKGKNFLPAYILTKSTGVRLFLISGGYFPVIMRIG